MFPLKIIKSQSGFESELKYYGFKENRKFY